MSFHLAVDIGGTQLRAALYSNNHEIPIKLARTTTQGDNQTPQVRLIKLISSIMPAEEKVLAVGVAAPGPVDPDLGLLLEAPNIPGWENVPLQQLLESHFHVPVAVGNDANMAALGEWKYGAARGHHHVLYLTISTGIGAGVIIADQLLLGSRGLATEIGHTTIQPDGPLCGCGQRGHLEAFASGTAIVRWVQEELARGIASSLPTGQRLTGKLITEAAQNGDTLAIAALERSGRYIGLALANLVLIFNPTAVVIGGGVSQSGYLLIDPICRALNLFVMSPAYVRDLVVTTAKLGDEAGLLGALALARSINPD
jgi:glucokinase